MNYNFNQDLSTDKWDIKIDTAERYGYFERHSDGAGGGLWFVASEDKPGVVELRDFDGIYELPRSVIAALRGAGYYLDDTFD
jgi:hypothetical protein